MIPADGTHASPSDDQATVAIPPETQRLGVSARGAELFAAEWMRHYGAIDATATRRSAAGGIDVVSTKYIAQVKNYIGSVGVVEVRELAGVAAVDRRQPLSFTSGTYAAGAASFGDSAGIALSQYDAVAGTLTAANPLARRHLELGFELVAYVPLPTDNPS